MIRNNKTLGILSTMNGWCFLQREDGSHLFMTRMFRHSTQGQGQDDQDGYTGPQGFTILKALYYFSYLAEVTDNTVETAGDQLGVVVLPLSGSARGLASVVQIRQRHAQILPRPPAVQGQQPQQQYIQFLFKPWLKENQLGHKTWIAELLPEHEKVVFKLWDGWKFDGSERDHEVAMYMRLQSLWGKCVPDLLGSTPIDFLHAIILQYIKALVLHIRLIIGFPRF
jgi:hypothetical protein